IVRRIVGGADCLDAELPQDSLGSQLRRAPPGVGFLPNALRGILVEQLVDAEIAAQFEVGPMVERITEGTRHRSRPSLELVAWRGGARAKFLADAIGAHGSPFVVIAFQPDLEEVGKLAVVGDVGRRKVTMEVQDGLRPGKAAVETL